MQKIIFLSILFLAVSCTEEKPVATTPPPTQSTTPEPAVDNFKYDDIIKMLEESYDYSRENGTLVDLSTEGAPRHIQISKVAYDGEQKSVVMEQTKRDIVYVAFQTFARTDIDQLTITSVPISPEGRYYDTYRLTLTVKRDAAREILKKYLNTEDFKILYQQISGIWAPSQSFNVLKHDKLQETYSGLKK